LQGNCQLGTTTVAGLYLTTKMDCWLQTHVVTFEGGALHCFCPRAPKTLVTLLHYIYIFDCSCPVMEFCQVKNSVCFQVLHSPILAALPHGTRLVGNNQTVAFSRGRHLYSAGWPSRWALAHILSDVYICSLLMLNVFSRKMGTFSNRHIVS